METHLGWKDASLYADRSPSRKADERVNRSGSRAPGAGPRTIDISSPKGELGIVSRSASAFGRRSGTSSPLERVIDGADVIGGLSCTRDLHRGLMEQKLQNIQHEADVMQEELKETNSRLSRVTKQLNEQKVEFSSLTQRYGETVEKLTATEGSVKRLEEHLVHERQQHANVRGECDRLKTMLQETQWEVERARRELQQERERPTVDQSEVQRLLNDRTRYIPTGEVQQRIDEIRDTHKAFAGRLTDSFSVLLRAQEEDEASAIATRNSVLSLVAEFESKLNGVEDVLTSLQEQMLAFSEVSEQETMEMINTLIVENKELWKHLSKLKGENETLSTKLEAERRRGDVVPRDQHECTQKKLALTTDKLTDALEAIETQTRQRKAHEAQINELTATNRSLKDQIKRLTGDISAAQAEAGQCKDQLRENKITVKESTRRADELWELLSVERRQSGEKIAQMTEDCKKLRRDCENLSERLAKEQEKARKECQRLKDELHKAEESAKTLQRELNNRDLSFENYKQQSEGQQQEMARSMKEDLAKTKKRLEHELDVTQRRLQKQLDAVGELERERDKERSERRAVEATVAKLEAELAGLRTENQQQQYRLQQLTERTQRMDLEADHLRQKRDSAENEVRQLQLELNRLQDQKCEVEQQLAKERETHTHDSQKYKEDVLKIDKNSNTLQEKLHKARLRITELEQQQQKSLKEADDEKKLEEKNLQLQTQNREVKLENESLREEIKRINKKMKSVEHLSKQLEDARERLLVLPALREAAEEARRDVERAVEETEALRQERDTMAEKLDSFLDIRRRAPKTDVEWTHLLHNVKEQVQQLDGKPSMPRSWKQQEGIPLSITTRPGGYSEMYRNNQRSLSGGRKQQQCSATQGCCQLVESPTQSNGATMPRPWR
ncbi:hypothetical protein, conserved [Trypanosoma brucei gambiense DAL972]|uniref:Uncharacterized protein n=1 Tax=Trypanosoma brucei gambiense (strain MHOM/CI/86/DAL972) TaxID=679716 RepID=D0A592_TRYB9|nr:hypothetical protein, conserved [Trypanosoma brucei gambiense DAL972]CBH16436.1 hypothetical protein, conserved [Trypanosoma brucei gambiense DAL972]|eukprot:XP_011778700.1 hypothetical protein, conserved [Trypanosoma brucei gambiense DAL972]